MIQKGLQLYLQLSRRLVKVFIFFIFKISLINLIINKFSAPVVDKFKREGNSSSIGVPPAKKLKVAIAGTRPGIPGPSGSSLLPIDRLTGAPAGAEPWEALAVDCEASELFESVMGCLQNNKMDKAVGIILGVIRTVRSHRSKICKVVYSSLFLLCSCKPTLYSNEHVVAAMLSVLRRDVNTGMKGTNKTNCYVHMLLINLLTHAFSDIVNWPDQFLKVSLRCLTIKGVHLLTLYLFTVIC